jgi:cytochrome P450
VNPSDREPVTAVQSADRVRALRQQLVYDFSDPKLRVDPVADLNAADEVRATCPMFFDEPAGEWLVFDYERTREILEHVELFSSQLAQADPPAGPSPENGRTAPFRPIPLANDPPEQPAYRKLLNPLFAPDKVTPIEDDLRRFANELLDPIVERGEGDLISEFCMPFPTITFCRIMGWPLEDHERLTRWARLWFCSSSPDTAELLGITDLLPDGRPTQAAAQRVVQQTTAEVLAYMKDIYDQRKRTPQDDVITKLIDARYEGKRPLTQEEIISISFVLFLGGLHTVVGQFGLILRDFALHPEHRQAFIDIMDDEKQAATAVQELVRLQSITVSARRVTQDCVFHGFALEKDQLIVFDTGAADRDPDKFEHGDRLQLDRRPNAHLGFGHGRHRCLGIHLANRELRIGLQEVLRRMPDYSITVGCESRGTTSVTRGVDSLPITVERAGPDGVAHGEAPTNRLV